MRVDTPPPSQFNPSIPPVVDAAVARAIARDPADRYPDCRELAKALRFVLDELSETERSTQCGVSLMTTDPDRTDGGGGG